MLELPGCIVLQRTTFSDSLSLQSCPALGGIGG
jgi:hypothetical protein